MEAQRSNVTYKNSSCVLVFLAMIVVLYILWYLYREWARREWVKNVGTDIATLTAQINAASAAYDQKSGEGQAVTLYYNPKCPHCRRIMPTWQNIQMQFGGRLVGAVDCSSSVCPNDIAGVPTIRSMRDHYDYKGERDYESLYAFVSRCVARV